ncbi:MAG: TSUP family transporter [Acetobacteraceae bacterium]|nr:TSUP family transporter [Acetobacteraceae bacterium]
MLDLMTLVVVAFGALVGAVAAGAAGFAFAVVASAVWLHAVDPVRSAFLVVSLGTILHAGLVWKLRRAISWQRLAPFLAGGAVGVPIGVALLTVTDPAPLRRALGALLLAFGLYALAVRGLPRIAWGGRGADATIGLTGGMLGGVGGFAGVPTTIWTQLRGWPKEVARGVFQPFILASHVATLVLLGGLTLDARALVLAAAALPGLALGAWLGLRLYGRLDEARFRRLLAAFVVLSGLSLLF